MTRVKHSKNVVTTPTLFEYCCNYELIGFLLNVGADMSQSYPGWSTISKILIPPLYKEKRNEKHE